MNLIHSAYICKSLFIDVMDIYLQTSKPEEIANLLVQQVTSTVEWHRSIDFCKQQDIDEFLCFGPGKVLANLLKKEYPLDKIRSVATADDIDFLYDDLKLKIVNSVSRTQDK
jgi:malonyl CoA-acyl carrier protein transacylase